MEIDQEKFNKLRQQAEKDYEAVGKVWCPYLKDDIHFNSVGFQHLLFKSWNRARSEAEQYNRLRLLPLAIEIVSKSHTLQEYDERQEFVRQKTNSLWCKTLKLVRYYAFVAVVMDKEIRVKVVVKEIEGSAKIFYSLYPLFKIVKDSFGRNKKVFYSGDLEED